MQTRLWLEIHLTEQKEQASASLVSHKCIVSELKLTAYLREERVGSTRGCDVQTYQDVKRQGENWDVPFAGYCRQSTGDYRAVKGSRK